MNRKHLLLRLCLLAVMGLSALVLHLPAAAQAPRVLNDLYTADAPSVEIDLSYGLCVMLTDAVRVNGEAVGTFLIDTGANMTIITPDVARRLGLEAGGTFDLDGRQGVAYSVDTLELGPLMLSHYLIGELDLSGFQQFSEPIAGILGADVLSQLPITIDYRSRTLTLHDPDRFTPPADARATDLVMVHGQNNAAGNAQTDRPGCPAVYGSINGERVLILMDTGLNSSAIVSGWFAAMQPERVGGPVYPLLMPARLSDSPGEMHNFSVDGLELFGDRIEGLEDAAAEVQEQPEETEFGAVVGGIVLRDYRLTMDMRSRRLWVEPAEIDREWLEALVEHDQLEQPNVSGFPELLDAARVGDRALFEALLEAGASPLAVDAHQSNILHMALFGQSRACLELVLSHEPSPDVNSRNAELVTPLALASALGREDLAELLLDHGATPDLISQDGETALHYAAEGGHTQVIAALLDHGADINVGGTRGTPPIMFAAINGHLDAVQLLVERGADASVIDPGGKTLMHAAAASGQVQMVRYAAGVVPADLVSRPTGLGITPLMIVAQIGDGESAQVLIDAGADMTRTAIQEMRVGRQMAIHVAASAGSTDVLGVLINAGADADQPTSRGLTPLMLASYGGNRAAAQALLDSGVRVDATNIDGVTALHFAVNASHPDLAALLIDAGADILIGDSNGTRPLDYAAIRGDVDSARLLLSAGADPTAVGRHGFTAIQIATDRRQPRVAELLRRWAEREE